MIKANFNAYDRYVTDSLYQWDLNRVLSVTGLNLSVVPEVHFSNANMEKAIVRQASMINHVVSVAIPNSLLQDPLTIKAHIGIYEGETFKVVEKVEIPVIPRERPLDYRIEDADEEIYSFTRLENMIENIDEKWSEFTTATVDSAVNVWLTQHPEATTTVQDGALTEAKFSDELKKKINNTYKNVAAMLSDNNSEIGTVVKTLGYFDVGDGGGMTYEIIDAKEKTYDIQGASVAFRPVLLSNCATPKMFGTKNDGVSSDNEGLQACFDFVADYNIPIIDGLGLCYYVDSSTQSIVDHYGVYIKSGVELKNYNSKLLPSAVDMTPVLGFIMRAENTYYIHDCKFDGSYGTLANSTVSREDGGRHCLFFTYEDTSFPNDFRASGDILIERCSIIDADSYGVCLSPCDNKFIVRDCDFKMYGPSILTHATNCFVENCRSTNLKSYKTMVRSFCHDEMEFSSNYTGDKIKNVYIKNCVVDSNMIFKAHHSPQVGVQYGEIKIENCTNESVNSGDVISLYNTDYDNLLVVDRVDLIDCVTFAQTETNYEQNVGLTGCKVARLNVDFCPQNITLAHCEIEFFKYTGREMIPKYIEIGASTFGKIEFDGVTFNNSTSTYALLSTYTDGTTIVNTFVLKNCQINSAFKMLSPDIIFETIDVSNLFVADGVSLGTLCELGSSQEKVNIYFRNCTILGTPSGHIVYLYNSACTGVLLLQNVVHKGFNVSIGAMTKHEINCTNITN